MEAQIFSYENDDRGIIIKKLGKPIARATDETALKQIIQCLERDSQ